MVGHGHCFALFIPGGLQGGVGDRVIIQEAAVLHRITHVLRLGAGETVLLFDATYVWLGRIAKVSKKFIELIIEQVDGHKAVIPEIHWLLPILEKDSFEEALSHATVMGVTSITPIITKQSARQVRLSSERQAKIMAAAAEQSKQFVFPIIRPIISFEEALAQRSKEAPFILFDEDGEPALPIMESLAHSKPSLVTVLSGPEGGLTHDEVAYARSQGALVCALTPTILRAWVAVSLGAGMLRACLKQ